MQSVLKWILRIALMLLLAVLVVGFVKREELARLLAVNSLFDEGQIVQNFSNMNAAFLNTPVPRGDSPVSELPVGSEMGLPDGAEDWLIERSATSLLVLHDGKIVHETYHLGTRPLDLRISWSIAKSYMSALMGIVLAEGHITSLDDPVTQYAPILENSAYDGASILNVLQMTSGVKFNEDYLDFNSDINRMGRVLALGRTMDGFAAGLQQREGATGQTWRYVSIDTHVLSMVIRGATGRDIPSLLSEKIMVPLGLEAEPYFITDGEGVAFALGGLNLTTRDYARFGLMIEQNGQFESQQIVPADWVSASTVPSAPTAAGQMGYGYQWWIPVGASSGQFMARGIYGQYLYIDQDRDVVIVMTAADRNFRTEGVHRQNVAMFRRIVDAL